MKIKTETLTGPALDWAAMLARDGAPWCTWQAMVDLHAGMSTMSTNWMFGGPIIEKMEIGIRRNVPCSAGREWEAAPSITAKGAGGRWCYGPTPLIAAMRCYVASRFGDEVEIPEELA